MLGETDGGGTLSEALTADVEAVLSDQTSGVVANLAATGAFTVGSWATVPNVIVRHGVEIERCSFELA